MKKIRYSPEAKNKILQMKSNMEVRYGRKKASAIIQKLVKSIDDLQIFEKKGIAVEQCLGIPCDYRMLILSHNYIFYCIKDNNIDIIDIYNEKEDFLWKLFGIKTTTQETLDYWQE